MTDMYRPDWCEECGLHLAIPAYVFVLGKPWRKPLRCPVCVDELERKKAA